MTIVELALVVIALSAAALGIAVGVLVRRALPLLSDSRSLVQNANRGMDRANHILGDLEDTVGEVRGVERRVSRTLHLALDQVEPGLHGIMALIAGVNGIIRGLASRGSRRRHDEQTNRNRTPTKKGAEHE